MVNYKIKCINCGTEFDGKLDNCPSCGEDYNIENVERDFEESLKRIGIDAAKKLWEMGNIYEKY